MVIPDKLIVTLSEWKGFGRKKIGAICSYLNSLDMGTIAEEEYFDIICEVYEEGLLKGLKERPTRAAYEESKQSAEYILEASRRQGIKIVSSCNVPGFPLKLVDTVNEEGRQDVPILLYYKGDLSTTAKPGVAIIGTRNPSPEGVEAARYVADKFAKFGFNIVSGLALGCDTAAHEGAIALSHHSTTAFVAHGLDMVYPKENEGLFDRILERGGLIMSEYPIGSGVDRYKLVARDRLQAGLADATIVIQTGEHGGTMHAVRCTQKLGKPLYALNYKKALSPEFIGGNEMLIKGGSAIPLSSENLQSVICDLTDLCERKKGFI